MTAAPSTPRSGAAGGVGVIVPADWSLVPLGDDAVTGRAVADMVDHQYGRGDELAGLRRQVRVSVLSCARRATAAGGRLMAFMLTRVGDLPLPATMTAYRRPGSLATSDDVTALCGSLSDFATVTGGALDVGDGPFGVVVRGIRERATPVAGVSDADEVPVLICDYWTDPQDGEGVVNLSFSTPLTGLREGWVELFDAIVGTLHHLDGQ